MLVAPELLGATITTVVIDWVGAPTGLKRTAAANIGVIDKINKNAAITKTGSLPDENSLPMIVASEYVLGRFSQLRLSLLACSHCSVGQL